MHDASLILDPYCGVDNSIKSVVIKAHAEREEQYGAIARSRIDQPLEQDLRN